MNLHDRNENLHLIAAAVTSIMVLAAMGITGIEILRMFSVAESYRAMWDAFRFQEWWWFAAGLTLGFCSNVARREFQNRYIFHGVIPASIMIWVFLMWVAFYMSISGVVSNLKMGVVS